MTDVFEKISNCTCGRPAIYGSDIHGVEGHFIGCKSCTSISDGVFVLEDSRDVAVEKWNEEMKNRKAKSDEQNN